MNSPLHITILSSGRPARSKRYGNVPMGSFYQTLSDGAAAVTTAGADLVLVDPQYSRFLRANADVDSYAQALQQTAAGQGWCCSTAST